MEGTVFVVYRWAIYLLLLIEQAILMLTQGGAVQSTFSGSCPGSFLSSRTDVNILLLKCYGIHASCIAWLCFLSFCPRFIIYFAIYFFCRCNGYVTAWKRLTVHQAPNILTIALKRFQVSFICLCNII